MKIMHKSVDKSVDGGMPMEAYADLEFLKGGAVSRDYFCPPFDPERVL